VPRTDVSGDVPSPRQHCGLGPCVGQAEPSGNKRILRDQEDWMDIDYNEMSTWKLDETHWDQTVSSRTAPLAGVQQRWRIPTRHSLWSSEASRERCSEIMVEQFRLAFPQLTEVYVYYDLLEGALRLAPHHIVPESDVAKLTVASEIQDQLSRKVGWAQGWRTVWRNDEDNKHVHSIEGKQASQRTRRVIKMTLPCAVRDYWTLQRSEYPDLPWDLLWGPLRFGMRHLDTPRAVLVFWLGLVGVSDELLILHDCPASVVIGFLSGLTDLWQANVDSPRFPFGFRSCLYWHHLCGYIPSRYRLPIRTPTEWLSEDVSSRVGIAWWVEQFEEKIGKEYRSFEQPSAFKAHPPFLHWLHARFPWVTSGASSNSELVIDGVPMRTKLAAALSLSDEQLDNEVEHILLLANTMAGQEVPAPPPESMVQYLLKMFVKPEEQIKSRGLVTITLGKFFVDYYVEWCFVERYGGQLPWVDNRQTLDDYWELTETIRETSARFTKDKYGNWLLPLDLKGFDDRITGDCRYGWVVWRVWHIFSVKVEYVQGTGCNPGDGGTLSSLIIPRDAPEVIRAYVLLECSSGWVWSDAESYAGKLVEQMRRRGSFAVAEKVHGVVKWRGHTVAEMDEVYRRYSPSSGWWLAGQPSGLPDTIDFDSAASKVMIHSVLRAEIILGAGDDVAALKVTEMLQTFMPASRLPPAARNTRLFSRETAFWRQLDNSLVASDIVEGVADIYATAFGAEINATKQLISKGQCTEYLRTVLASTGATGYAARTFGKWLFVRDTRDQVLPQARAEVIVTIAKIVYDRIGRKGGMDRRVVAADIARAVSRKIGPRFVDCRGLKPRAERFNAEMAYLWLTSPTCFGGGGVWPWSKPYLDWTWLMTVKKDSGKTENLRFKSWVPPTVYSGEPEDNGLQVKLARMVPSRPFCVGEPAYAEPLSLDAPLDEIHPKWIERMNGEDLMKIGGFDVAATIPLPRIDFVSEVIVSKFAKLLQLNQLPNIRGTNEDTNMRFLNAAHYLAAHIFATMEAKGVQSLC